MFILHRLGISKNLSVLQGIGIKYLLLIIRLEQKQISKTCSVKLQRTCARLFLKVLIPRSLPTDLQERGKLSR